MSGAKHDPLDGRTWSTTEPVELKTAAEKGDAGIVVAWLVSSTTHAAFEVELAKHAFAAWDGWGGAEARKRASPLAELPVERVDAWGTERRWGFRYELPEADDDPREIEAL